MYKMGIIGFGGMGHHHAEMLSDYGRVSVKGVYDVNPERNKVAENKGLTAYSSADALFADREIDVVLIATTNEVHKELAVKAMESGKHVICEKPVTMDSNELSEIMEVAKRTGKVFTINQNRRTDKDFLLMKENVEAGLLGEPYVFESRVEGSRGVPPGWRALKHLGGGMMLDWGVHLIDQLLFMINEKVVNIFCKMYSVHYPEVDDNFRLTFTFESGKTAHIEVGTNNYITHPRWHVTGADGTLRIDDWSCDGKVVRCIDKENVWVDEIVYTKAGPTKTMAPRSEKSTETILISDDSTESGQDAFTKSAAVVYDQFFAAVDGVAPLTITAEQAMRVMKIMEAAFESSRTGTAVNVEI